MAPSLPTAVTARGFKTYNLPAPGVPYYTPVQGPAGSVTASAGADVPTLFTPLTIRGVTLANRFAVAPMCVYSADNGHMTDFHLVHLGQFAQRGAGLTIIEASSVLANGRISPEDVGLWDDSHVAPIRRVVDFVHSQGHKVGIQLAHGGRKASTLAMFLRRGDETAETVAAVAAAGPEGGLWPDNVVGPSALRYEDVGYATPHAASLAEIQEIVAAFGAAARRAVQAGVDVVEVHGAHGYLLSEFLSPQTNQRTDAYGGSFENRTRLLFEVLAAVRANVPATMPVFLRLSATEWLEEVSAEPSWTVEDTIRLARLLPAAGVDLLDVSSGGNSPQQKIRLDTYYQLDIAARVRQALAADADAAVRGLLVGAVGFITTPALAHEAVQKGGVPGGRTIEADLALVGRQFLREPEFVLWSAHKLGVPVHWPQQYTRALWRAGSTSRDS